MLAHPPNEDPPHLDAVVYHHRSTVRALRPFVNQSFVIQYKSVKHLRPVGERTRRLAELTGRRNLPGARGLESCEPEFIEEKGAMGLLSGLLVRTRSRHRGDEMTSRSRRRRPQRKVDPDQCNVASAGSNGQLLARFVERKFPGAETSIERSRPNSQGMKHACHTCNLR
jgi:hypothetical protein